MGICRDTGNIAAIGGILMNRKTQMKLYSRKYRKENPEKIKEDNAKYYRQRNLKEVERRLKALGES